MTTDSIGNQATKRERIYLSGPMSGIDNFNWPLFKAVGDALREQGHLILCPTEVGNTFDTPYHECLRADLKLLLDANAIAMLPGWESSRGATLELTIAVALRYTIYEVKTETMKLGEAYQLPLHHAADCLYQAARAR